MKKTISLLTILLFVIACKQPKKVDLLIVNAKVYTVNDSMKKVNSFAVKDGKFIAVGNSKKLSDLYEATTIVDAKQKSIYPGLIDAHCHFLGMGLVAQKIRLEGT